MRIAPFSKKTALLRLPAAGDPLEIGRHQIGRRQGLIESAG
jgi:hypothetical protein